MMDTTTTKVMLPNPCGCGPFHAVGGQGAIDKRNRVIINYNRTNQSSLLVISE
jgi:hypothetical protein